jgi:uncharacterized protein (TIGR02996 family)
MPQREAFLQAIIADPDDDTTRLVYADWLEENGDEADRARAEFIRIQFEQERLPEHDARRKEVETRAAELHKAHAATWLRGAWNKWVPGVGLFRRGFLETIEASPDSLKEHAVALLAREPVTDLRLNRFDDDEAEAKEIASWPWLARFRKLDTEDTQMDEAPLATLLRSPHLTGLRELRISPYKQGTGAIKALAANRALAGLTHLTLEALWHNGDAIVTTLAGIKHLDRLTHLAFGSNGIGLAGATVLARSPILRNITHLTFDADNSRGPRLGDDGFLTLIGSRHLKNLTDLTVGWQEIGDASLIALSRSPNAGKLVRLALPVNNFGPAGMEALGSSRRLANLEELRLAVAGLRDDGAEAFARGTVLTRLRHLELIGFQGKPYPDNAIGDAGLAALANCPMLANVRVLNLEGNAGIGAAGATALAESPYLTQLEELIFEGSAIGPDGAKALAKSANLARLRKLVLKSAKIGDAGAKALAKSPHLTNLRFLSLWDCDLHAAGARAIAESPFLQGVTYLSFLRNPLRKSMLEALERT